MKISPFSKRYHVRRMKKNRCCKYIFAVQRKNSLYYQYCLPPVTRQSILVDMEALHPNKKMFDKYYIGYYKGGELIAIMDLIMAYPGLGLRTIRIITPWLQPNGFYRNKKIRK